MVSVEQRGKANLRKAVSDALKRTIDGMITNAALFKTHISVPGQT
jgi:hypothetical protein